MLGPGFTSISVRPLRTWLRCLAGSATLKFSEPNSATGSTTFDALMPAVNEV